MKIISNKIINYPFAAIMWILLSLLLVAFCSYVGLHSKFWIIVSFISGVIIIFGDRTYVPILSSGLLIFNGEEVKRINGDSVWLDPGMYFTFWIFTVSEKEAQKMEKRDVIIPSFNCQDINRLGLTAEANGDWKIIDHDKFKEQDEAKMESNLVSLVRRSVIRVCATLDFDTKIKGKDLGEVIMIDTVFQKECGKYGVSFHNLIADAIPADLKQENLNSYYKKLYQEEVEKYPKDHKFTHDEIKDINETVQVKLGQAKKIVTNSPLLGRYDVKD